MDLPTCPACGQSVLDDDAVDCPFCGASLKGGGKGSAPKKPIPAVSKKPAATTPAAKPSAPEKPASKGDDDFIEVDESARKAIPLSVKATAQKTVEIRCRMCDTVGYLAPQHQGELVRCANPKCSVPVFKSPRPVEAPKVEAKPKRPPMSPVTKLFTGVGVLVVLGLGGFIYSQGGFGGGKQEVQGLTEEQKREIEESKRLIAEKKQKDEEEAARKKTEAEAAKAVVNPAQQAEAELAELVKKWPRQAIDAARNATTNRKAYARRMAAVAFAERGDVTAAREQIDQLKNVSSSTSHELIPPLTVLAWNRLQAGQAAEAKALVDAAANCAGNIPSRGRFPIDCTLALATAQAATGSFDDAVKTVAMRKESHYLEQLAAAWLIGYADGTHLLSRQSYPGRTAVVRDEPAGWVAPRETGVAVALALRGRVTEGAEFCARLKDFDARSGASVAFVTTLGSLPESVQAARVAAFDKVFAAAERSSGLRARLLIARAGWDKAFAAEAVTQATQLLGTPEPLPVPELASTREFLEYRLPERTESLARALAWGELGALQAIGSVGADAADVSFNTALALARSTAPGLSFALEKQALVERSSTQELRSRMLSELGLKKNDDAERRVVAFKRQVDLVVGAAWDRFDTTVRILSLAVASGRTQVAKQELESGLDAQTASSAQPFARSLVARGFGSAVLDGIAAMDPPPATNQYLNVPAAARAALIASGDVNALMAVANKPQENRGGLYDEVVYTTAERLVEAGNYAGAVNFLMGLRDVDSQEQGLWLAAVRAAKAGKALEFWNAARPAVGRPTLEAAVVGGLLQAIPVK